MLDEFVGKNVVIDLNSPYVCLGVLEDSDEHFLQLRDADLHDLRDTKTTRENYIVAAMAAGVHVNRKRMLLARREVIAISLAKDVVTK
ncbi:MAG: hypothetical protein K2X38_16165 [Gemmataceae bacterium]|nr:hypothetical protein [Gemmataceae bacterium]